MPAKKSATPGADTPSGGGSPTPRGSRRPLVVNVSIGGVWYGPAWGNADAYPDDGHDGRPELFGD